MRLIFYRTPSFELSKKALLPHRVSRCSATIFLRNSDRIFEKK